MVQEKYNQNDRTYLKAVPAPPEILSGRSGPQILLYYLLHVRGDSSLGLLSDRCNICPRSRTTDGIGVAALRVTVHLAGTCSVEVVYAGSHRQRCTTGRPP